MKNPRAKYNKQKKENETKFTKIYSNPVHLLTRPSSTFQQNSGLGFFRTDMQPL